VRIFLQHVSNVLRLILIFKISLQRRTIKLENIKSKGVAGIWVCISSAHGVTRLRHIEIFYQMITIESSAEVKTEGSDLLMLRRRILLSGWHANILDQNYTKILTTSPLSLQIAQDTCSVQASQKSRVPVSRLLGWAINLRDLYLTTIRTVGFGRIMLQTCTGKRQRAPFKLSASPSDFQDTHCHWAGDLLMVV
jgi:hypothetical protein